MTVRPIYVVPHPVLRKPAEIVTSVGLDIRQLMDDMVDSMYAAKGIGLAAPQVGVSQRVVVLDVEQRENEDGKPGTPQFFVNPEIVWSSEEMNVYNEGCLSIPEQFADVERPARVRVRFLDYHGKEAEIEADGLLATCLQHEIDHINGILFIDHISKLKQDMILRKVKKWTKEFAEDIKETHVIS